MTERGVSVDRTQSKLGVFVGHSIHNNRSKTVLLSERSQYVHLTRSKGVLTLTLVPDKLRFG